MKDLRGPAPDASPGTKAPGDLVGLALVSLIVGASSGLLGAVFRLALARGDFLRGEVVGWAHGRAAGLLFVVGACACATAAATWLVQRFAPTASGSGIPQVEAVLEGKESPARSRLIGVKFAGGLLAMGSGLALGREGPTVQMGASIGNVLARLFPCGPDDSRVLMAAGAGAGLATAFNAPIAGAVFVLEELVRRFDTRIAIAALGASAAAIGVARIFLGDAPDFHVAAQPYPGFGTALVHILLGAVAGLFGIVYNRAILGALATADRLRTWPPELRAAAVGAAVGLLAWFAPDLVGEGDPLTQRALAGTMALSAALLVFVVRFGLGPLSYAAGTPGGLFAPMLVLGAQIGLLFAAACGSLVPDLTPTPTSLAIVAMAAFFTAVVRAPLTGIVLVTEMSGSLTLMLPMLAACFAAMAVPTWLDNPPIYDSLARRDHP